MQEAQELPRLNIDEEREIMARCGGKPRITGGESGWWFGSNPSPADITEQIIKPFNADAGTKLVEGDKVCLWKFPQSINGGKHIPYSWQLTGSCVNSGANNALSIRLAIEVLRIGDPGSWHIPFTLPAYGYSRLLAYGDNSEGEGSSGDAIALALSKMGFTAADYTSIAGMPTPKIYGSAYCYDERTEMKFSAAHNCPQSIKDACSPHKLEFTKLTTLDECEKSIRRCEPFSFAGNWGSTMRMSYRGSGKERVLFGEHASSWNHQQSVIAVWLHPSLGRLWYIMNNWYQLMNGVAVPVHGLPANDEPPGGYWVDDSAIQYQLNCRGGELRGYSQAGDPFSDGMLSVLAV